MEIHHFRNHPSWSEKNPQKNSRIEMFPGFFCVSRFVNLPRIALNIYIYICPWKSSFKGILRRPWETSLRCTFHWLWCFYWTWVSWSSRRFRETGGYENWDSVGLWRHGIQYSHKRPRRQNGRNTEFWCVEGFSLLMFVVSIWLHFMCHVCFYI